MKKTYVMSDIHGQKEKFDAMLKKIKFTASDKLYIIGDIIDRGPESIELLKYVMKQKNILLIKGNHEAMMLESIELGNQIRNNETGELELAVEVYKDWLLNGGEKTLEQFRSQTKLMQTKILKYLKELENYKIIEVEGVYYLLIHAGLFIPKNNLDIKSLIDANIEQDLHLYVREEFWNSKFKVQVINETENKYEDIVFVVGHTSTRYLPGILEKITKDNTKRCENNKIFKTKDKIGIDTGAHLKEGRLACLRLDDMKEIYV